MMKKYISLIALLLAVLLCSGCAADNAAAEKTEHPDLAPTLNAAREAYDGGSFAESLELYLTAMEYDSKSMDARLGVVRCQIELGNYSLASMNLSMAAQIEPENEALYDAYSRLSEASGDYHYIQDAISLAKENQVESFLSRIPASPELLLEPGTYDVCQLLEVSHSDPDAQILVTVNNSTNHNVNVYEQNYEAPLNLSRGSNVVSAFAVKDGIPSPVITGEYQIVYPEKEVIFLDPLIEYLVRMELGIPEGPLTNYACENVSMLNWNDLRELYQNYREFERAQLSTLEDLKMLPGLTQLYLTNQSANLDYSPLRYCPGLFVLDLSNCNLRDTDMLQYAPNVNHLWLSNNNISDISELEKKTNLYGFDLYYNGTALDLTEVLRNNKQLTDIGIEDIQLPDYNVLKELPDLAYLRLYGITYADFTAIGELSQLEELYVLYNNANGRRESRSGVYMDDLSFLTNMENLFYLGLCGVRDPEQLQYLSSLPGLTTLVFNYSDVTENPAVIAKLEAMLPNCQIHY